MPLHPTTPYQLLLIGGSAGSLEVILPLLAELKKDFPLPIVIVVHRKTDMDGMLTSLMASRTELPTKEAEEKEKIENGKIYIAPADYHLLIEKDKTFSLDYSEKINYSRPSIDVCFETAAEAYGPAAIALLLSGANDDGVAGLQAIKAAGGTTIVQHPDAAVVPYMPEFAIKNTRVDYIVKNAEMAPLLHRLCS